MIPLDFNRRRHCSIFPDTRDWFRGTNITSLRIKQDNTSFIFVRNDYIHGLHFPFESMRFSHFALRKRSSLKISTKGLHFHISNKLTHESEVFLTLNKVNRINYDKEATFFVTRKWVCGHLTTDFAQDALSHVKNELIPFMPENFFFPWRKLSWTVVKRFLIHLYLKRWFK